MGAFKVALFSEEFPPFTFGGIGSFCYDLSNALSRKGIPTTVFCGRATKMTVKRVNSNLEVIRLPCFDFPPRFLWFQLQNVRLFLRLLREYSVLHIVNPEVGPAISEVARILKIPVVTTIHGTYLLSLRLTLSSPVSHWRLRDIGFKFLGYPLYELSNDLSLRSSSHITVCSFSTLAELKSLHPKLPLDRTSVIYNGINFDEFSENSEELQDENLSIISFGRLFWTKGFTYLIKAIANIHDDFPAVNVQIFGDGPMKRDLREMVSGLGLNATIQIRDFIPHSQLIKEIKKASIAVFPTLAEAQPISFLETMACGKPVIAFDLPFSREVVKDMNNGLLAKPASAEDLSAKMRTLLADEDLRLSLGKNALSYVRREHNWDTLVDKHIGIYRTIAGTSV